MATMPPSDPNVPGRVPERASEQSPDQPVVPSSAPPPAFPQPGAYPPPDQIPHPAPPQGYPPQGEGPYGAPPSGYPPQGEGPYGAPPPGYPPQSQAGQLADFWVRAGQAILDGLILAIPVGVIYGVVAVSSYVLGQLVLAAAVFGYQFLTIQNLEGQTIGMKALGLKVVREEDGGPLPPDRLAIRSAYFVAATVVGIVQPVLGVLVGLALAVGYLAVLWDPRKQGWHDKLAKALVIRTK